MEQAHLAAKFAMVTLCSFLEPVQIGLEVVLRQEGRAIDALQHGVPAVATPIGACDGHELEAVGGDLARVLEMRTTAKVLPIPVPIHADVLIGGDRLDQFDLVGLIPRPVVGDGLSRGQSSVGQDRAP